MTQVIKYFVIKTPMYPNLFKVTSKEYVTTNATCNYFRTRELAQKEADKRNNFPEK